VLLLYTCIILYRNILLMVIARNFSCGFTDMVMYAYG